jgi:hypothetical protein
MAGDKIIHHQAGHLGSIQGPSEKRWGYLNPYVCDWCNHGLNDIITNDIRGEYYLYENIGCKTKSDFAAPQQLYCKNKTFIGAWRSRFAIWENKGIVAINYDGFLQFFAKDCSNKTQLIPQDWLRYVDGSLIKACGNGGLWGRAVLFAVDWDLDGTIDLIIGTEQTPVFNAHFPVIATFFWLNNVGTNSQPLFERARLITLKDGTFINLGLHQSSPWCGDLTGDGNIDLVSGAEDGKIYLWSRDQLKWDWDSSTVNFKN